MNSKQNYLRAIYELTDGGDSNTTTSELADYLEVSNASVSEAIQKLESDGLVCRVPYKGFTLSPVGREKASELEEKYSVLEQFFGELGVKNPEKEADAVAHAISMEAVEKIRENSG
ncbi:MAG: metal-dependent transcriptional regulator [Candidatus Nanohaloarchaea archaeon]